VAPYDNEGLVRAGFDAWNAGDTEALAALYTDDAVLETPPGWPEPGPFVGRDEVMRQWAFMREAWQTDAIELLGECATAGDKVAARMVWRTRGSGPDAEIEMTILFTARNGLAVRQQFFWDHEEALASMGH
jgi:ketosteroid isomerase-like protein